MQFFPYNFYIVYLAAVNQTRCRLLYN